MASKSMSLEAPEPSSASSSALTSRASCAASEFFFETVFRFAAPGPRLANLFIHFHQVAGEMTQPPILGDLLACLGHECFRNDSGRGLAFHIMGERPRGAMARIAGLGTMAVRFAALAVTLD